MKYGESSKILRLFTEKYGILPVMAKGAYLPKSSFVSLSQPFTLGKFTLGEGQSFYYLEYGEIIHVPMKFRSSYDKIISASVMAEVTRKTLQEGEVNPKIFSLLRKAYMVLEDTTSEKLLLAGYLMKLLTFLGFRPSLHQCIRCGKIVTTPRIYDISGGVRCCECGGNPGNCIKVDENVGEGMKKILYTPLDQFDELDINQETAKEIIDIMIKGLQYHLDIQSFSSLKLLP